MRVEKTPKREALFWDKVNKLPGENACWLWTGAKNSKGYGWITVHVDGIQRFYFAHKVSYEWEYGSIPNSKIIRHTCDNPPCIRPSHLLIGTHQDNTNDKMSRGRYVSGVAEITAEDAVDIRHRRANGESVKSLCETYNFSMQHINAICRGLYWPDAGGPLTHAFRISDDTIVGVIQDLKYLTRSQCRLKYDLSKAAIEQIATGKGRFAAFYSQ